MSGFDKAKDKAKQTKGKIKERLGKATGNEELKASGQRDQLAGEAQEVAHDVRDRATHAAHEAKERLMGEEEGDEDRDETGHRDEDEDENP